MIDGDDWLARDKAYHVIFCFVISLTFSTLASFSRYAFIRRRRVWIGSVASFFAGAAKEIADEFGYFRSAGASFKDAVADFVGILLAAALLGFINRRSSVSDQTRIAEMV